MCYKPKMAFLDCMKSCKDNENNRSKSDKNIAFKCNSALRVSSS